MVQVILFFVAFGVLAAKGVGVIGSFLGALGIAIVGGFLLVAIIAGIAKR